MDNEQEAGVWYDEEDAYFGACSICRENDYVNLGANHYGVCRKHEIYWGIGSNLFSSWRGEDPAVWQRNLEMLRGFRPITERDRVPSETPPFRADAPAISSFDELDKLSAWLGETGGANCRSTEALERALAVCPEGPVTRFLKALIGPEPIPF